MTAQQLAESLEKFMSAPSTGATPIMRQSAFRLWRTPGTARVTVLLDSLTYERAIQKFSAEIQLIFSEFIRIIGLNRYIQKKFSENQKFLANNRNKFLNLALSPLFPEI